MLNDVSGNPIRAWDSRGHSFRTNYDPLRRPLRSFVTGANPAQPTQELLTERLVYGEQHPEAEAGNLRGALYLHLDQAGAVISEAHDFKGNPLRSSRRLTNVTQYRQAVDWRAVDDDQAALPTNPKALLDLAALEAALTPRLEANTYTSHTTYDALNRPMTLTTPHTLAMKPSVIRPTYNEANLLERVDVMLRGVTSGGQPIWTPFVTNIDYDAKGQRTRIDYGNGASTFYTYDPLTFRLVLLRTRRNAIVFPDDCPHPQPVPAGWPGCQLQNLHYTYDPAGNITHIRDDAQQRIFFDNQRIDSSNDYTYDALYRLIEATGREHLGQNGEQVPHSRNDALRVRQPHPNSGDAMARYCEKYIYDAVGNFLSMSHHRSCADSPGWTRTYEYNEPSLIETGKMGNRLSNAPLNGDPPSSVKQFAYDAHGNMTRMPHLPLMRWDYRDQLQATAQQVVSNGGTPEITYYVYDAAGQRVRKVTERQAQAGQTPVRKEERLYLGGFEIYRTYESDGETVELERETLHIMDDRQRIALVETRTKGSDAAPERLTRYQLGNHLGSASLELDAGAQVISYEEYSPYGSTSYLAVRSQTETPKRYRYTGKERDEESGLYYHGARYYLPWLGRWVCCDPLGLVDGVDVYAYVRGNPIKNLDIDGEETMEFEDLEITGEVKSSLELLSDASRLKSQTRDPTARQEYAEDMHTLRHQAMREGDMESLKFAVGTMGIATAGVVGGVVAGKLAVAAGLSQFVTSIVVGTGSGLATEGAQDIMGKDSTADDYALSASLGAAFGLVGPAKQAVSKFFAGRSGSGPHGPLPLATEPRGPIIKPLSDPKAEAKLKELVVKNLSSKPSDRPVKVVPKGMGQKIFEQGEVRGYFTQDKFLRGKTPAEMEKILGLKPGTLRDGAEVITLGEIPKPNQFEFIVPEGRPTGTPAGYTNVPGAPDYPVGLGAPQWYLKGAKPGSIHNVQPRETYIPPP
jgi:RHS repeat-associated protein